MAGQVDALLEQFERHRDPAVARDLCAKLLQQGEVSQISRAADAIRLYCAHEPQILASAGQLCLQVSLFEQAQALLVIAGKGAPRDPTVYALLGETLLRRGDADRAEKVFERALQLGATDPAITAWHNRAATLKTLQTSRGQDAVALEVERTTKPRLNGPQQLTGPSVSVQPPQRPAVRPLRNDAGRAVALPRVPETGPTPQLQGLREWGASHRAAEPTRQQAHTYEFTSQNGIPDREPHVQDAYANVGAQRRVPTTVDNLSHSAAGTDNECGDSTSEKARARQLAGAVGSDTTIGESEMPDAADVLQALAQSGVFEPSENPRVAINWEPSGPHVRQRGTKRILAAMALTAAAGTGFFFIVSHQRQNAHVLSETKLAVVDRDLASADATKLESADRTLSECFDLDSRSVHAARTWLRERTIRGILQGGAEVTGFEDGVARAKEVGVPDAELGFASVAPFLFQGDTSGAVATLAKWDRIAEKDATYQLVAGATLERAGDSRAAERYAAAARLDGSMMIAEFSAVRLAALEGDPTRAKAASDALKAKYPNRVEALALSALVWARLPHTNNGGELTDNEIPTEVAAVFARETELPIGLRAIPRALAAIVAEEKHNHEEFKNALGTAIGRAESPAMATYLGLLAAQAGEEGLARRAALAALSYSALYAPARGLAARVALLGGRLDEGVKATEDMDATSPDVAAVRAATAYEKGDPEQFSLALDATNVTAANHPLLTGLQHGRAVLEGAAPLSDTTLSALKNSHAPWADLIRMDALLDAGNVTAARTIAEGWKTEPALALRAVRLSRLARYEGNSDEAEKQSAVAIGGSTVTPRNLAERLFVLLSQGKKDEAKELLRKYPLVAGAYSGWFTAYVTASSGKPEDARVASKPLITPSSQSAYLARLVALMACGAMKDQKRGGELIRPMVQAKVINADVEAAASALNMPKLPKTR